MLHKIVKILFQFLNLALAPKILAVLLLPFTLLNSTLLALQLYIKRTHSSFLMYRKRICDLFNDDDCRDGSDLLHCNGKCFKNSFNAEHIKIVYHTYDFNSD